MKTEPQLNKVFCLFEGVVNIATLLSCLVLKGLFWVFGVHRWLEAAGLVREAGLVFRGPFRVDRGRVSGDAERFGFDLRRALSASPALATQQQAL